MSSKQGGFLIIDDDKNVEYRRVDRMASLFFANNPLTTNLRVGRSNRSGRAISSTGKQGLGKTGRPLGVGLFCFSKHMVTPRADLASGRAPLDGPNPFSADALLSPRSGAGQVRPTVSWPPCRGFDRLAAANGDEAKAASGHYECKYHHEIGIHLQNPSNRQVPVCALA